MPVWRPLRDHSVSPWRMMKTRGVVIVGRVGVSGRRTEEKAGRYRRRGGDQVKMFNFQGILGLRRASAPVQLVVLKTSLLPLVFG